MPGIAAESVSFLNALQPLAGAALALNLAYLNLEKFRYRNSICETAGKCLRALRANKKYVRSHEKHDHFRELRYLAALPDNSGADSEESGRSNAGQNKRPDKRWARLYAWGYSWRQDKVTCALAVIVSVFVLIAGTGHSAGLLGFIEPWLKSERIGLTFWLLLAVFTVSPMALVLTAGYYIVPRALKRIKRNEEQINIFFVEGGKDQAGYPQP